MKRLSFISFVLSAFLLIGFVACNSTDYDNSGSAYVDLGLSVKWATMNVGADIPEGYGVFYTYDEAQELFRDTTNRLPTKGEFYELINRCKWKWTKQNKIRGYRVTGPNGNSIFLPAAGTRLRNGKVLYVGEDGDYWSSNHRDSEYSWCLHIFSSGLFTHFYPRYSGQSVRLVQADADRTNPSDDIEESDYVDLGLSVKWATINVGADTPEGYGDLYTYDEAQELSSDTTNRLPTKGEFYELKNRCKWKWTKQNKIRGYRVTGPNGHSIFLPAAGHRYRDGGGNGHVGSVGTDGWYWSSTRCYSDTAWRLHFDSSGVWVSDNNRRDEFSVRLVLD